MQSMFKRSNAVQGLAYVQPTYTNKAMFLFDDKVINSVHSQLDHQLTDANK
jgi:hypothetical protein